MREIKFRAKHFNKWYYGNLTTHKGIDENGNVHVVYILTGLSVEHDMWLPICEDSYDTIGQFTGLCDCEGKEIYEGDILEGPMSDGSKVYHVVSYYDECPGFVVYPNGDKLGGPSNLDKKWIDECEKKVVGNIFDNPEFFIF